MTLQERVNFAEKACEISIHIAEDIYTEILLMQIGGKPVPPVLVQLAEKKWLQFHKSVEEYKSLKCSQQFQGLFELL